MVWEGGKGSILHWWARGELVEDKEKKMPHTAERR